jgi:hypothetical protein
MIRKAASALHWNICIMFGLHGKLQKFKLVLVRDRSFNLKGGLWFFVSFRNFFSDNTS